MTQVCGKARGHSGQNGTKCGTFCVLNGRIGRKNARNHEPMPSGSQEVSGSIPLISTKTKSHSVRNGFFVLAGHTWREKRCGSTECIFAAQKRRFFCMQCRKHKKMQSARRRAAAGVSRLSFHFLFSKNECISSVMRPDPDLTQTGAKTRWIYRDLFDKTARIFLERYKSNPASGGQFMPACGVFAYGFSRGSLLY